jgi:hypothetical protein
MKKPIGSGLMAQGTGESFIKPDVAELVLNFINSVTYKIDYYSNYQSREEHEEKLNRYHFITSCPSCSSW